MAPPKPALDFVDFVNASPTPYHAVRSAGARLEKAGFTLIRERDCWTSALKPGGKYYLTRNGSSIIAFAVGHKWRPGNPVAIVGAHTDSPCLRLKPVSKKSNVGYLQIGVETYGGGIWHSWFDRDLSIAGRVLVRQGDSVVQKLVKVDRPLLRIPTLAIHLNRDAGFDPNKETELFPIAGLAAAELNKASPEHDELVTASKDGFQPLDKMTDRHHPALLDLIAGELGVDVSAIADFELVLYDTQKSCIGGLADELIFSPRLDNLGMTYCAIMGLISSVKESSSLDSDSTIRLAACFDHEEIGSQSAQGAHSNMLPSVLRRLSILPGARDASSEADDSTAHEQTLSRSFLVSADMAHAVHPNYAAKHESSHQPAINKGTVIKVNANQRYATNSPGIILVQECARLAGVPLQLFVVRNDSPCGSTIGPGLAARMGMRTLDLGNPQLSMHSIRETGGTADVEHGLKLFHQFYHSYGRLESKILVD
ncbi:aminopeptidase I zinc metalloprotease (M18) domain-containing protein [Hirsutella rhossiliensis]|uniref:aspartyl aminopeptidase n=1 Tax=Hirsutella rhossiliensis TaxID=111463 RepID=A0A9P8N3I8_9HYPO|nr:aminopeptidase I zinc metalloprotease (M18) domain-containing protein [Hirsutella rhossiliensis]KAH0965947.1 aminopeptidase I zinc metalloprotease (M18) domain-containing protein [Hirsutella rhossiliensis]